MLYAIRKSDNKEFPVQKYSVSGDDGSINIWCNEWYGHHIVGQDCEITYRPKDFEEKAQQRRDDAVNSVLEKVDQSVIDKVLSQITPDEQQIVSDRMLLAAKIDDRMKELGVSKSYLACALGKSIGYIDKILSGTLKIRTKQLNSIYRILNLK